MRAFVLALAIVILAQVGVSAQGIQPGSTWVNHRGSQLTISAIGADGAITGTFVNKAPGFDCQNEGFPVSGWVEGDLINFAVRWKNANVDCRSVTAWSGYLAAGRMTTHWSLVYTDGHEKRPAHMFGSDFFRPE